MGPNKKNQQGFLNSKYYLDDIKTICQDYTKTYDKIECFDIYRRGHGKEDGIWEGRGMGVRRGYVREQGVCEGGGGM